MNMTENLKDWEVFTHELSNGYTIEAGLCRDTGHFGASISKDGVKTLDFSLSDETAEVLMQLWINLKYGKGVTEGKFYDVAFDLVEWVKPE
jgi:hypothetical protein